MNRNYFIVVIVVAVVSLLLTISSLWRDSHKSTIIPKELLSLRPQSPFKSYISAVGIVEASSDNIFIGSPVNRIVEKVEVAVGDHVKKGDVLFRLEARDLQADKFTRKIAYENALARLEKLEALPRREDVEASSALLKSAEVELAQAKSQFEAVQGLKETKALSQEEINRRLYAYQLAQAHVLQAQADLKKTKAGAWHPELEIARLEVLQAKANEQRVETDIARTIIRSPIDGTILQVKIHEGEYPPTDPSRTPPMILGVTEPMHLRVNINQFDASYYRTNTPAVAFLQGDAQAQFPLKFVKLEPYLVTKQNLNNDITEKVDTRVLQAIYSFDEKEHRVFVGQQMDVFIETNSPPLE